MEELAARGKRVFTTAEVQAQLGLPRNNVLAILGHLGRQKRILSLSRGFYALWPAAERQQGLHPLPVLDALMRFRNTSYYVGLLSAADRYGAAHHKPQRLQVLLPRQLRLRKAHKLGISLHTHTRFPSVGITRIKTPSGTVCFSSPELTVLDLIYFESACGGFDNLCLVLKALLPQLKSEPFMDAVKVYPYMACIQRAGYLLEFFQYNPRLLRSLRQWVARHKRVSVGLSSGSPKKGTINKKWGIIQNAPIEVEP